MGFNNLHQIVQADDAVLFFSEMNHEARVIRYYTRPWTGETHFLRSDDAVFEDACHEGNYSLKHILEGARVRDGQLPSGR